MHPDNNATLDLLTPIARIVCPDVSSIVAGTCGADFSSSERYGESKLSRPLLRKTFWIPVSWYSRKNLIINRSLFL